MDASIGYWVFVKFSCLFFILFNIFCHKTLCLQATHSVPHLTTSRIGSRIYPCYCRSRTASAISRPPAWCFETVEIQLCHKKLQDISAKYLIFKQLHIYHACKCLSDLCSLIVLICYKHVFHKNTLNLLSDWFETSTLSFGC